MNRVTTAQGQVQPCCADRSNRLPVYAGQPAGWLVDICGVCGRKHVTLTVRRADYVPARAS